MKRTRKTRYSTTAGTTVLAGNTDLAIRNTKSMSLQPEWNEEFHMMTKPVNNKTDFFPVFSGDDFKAAVCYPVMVEAWEKAKHGRHHRAFVKAFTKAERNTISRYYGRFYRWYLVTGTPRRVLCKLSTVVLLQRAIAFFASI